MEIRCLEGWGRRWWREKGSWWSMQLPLTGALGNSGTGAVCRALVGPRLRFTGMIPSGSRGGKKGGEGGNLLDIIVASCVKMGIR